MATKKITGNYFPIAVRLSKNQTLVVNRDKNSTVKIKGCVTIEGWGGANSPSSISISSGSTLQTFGDLIVGPGVHISIGNNATLKFGGKKNSTGSGITCNTRIMVNKYIEIGADSIIAWDVFITDSDWHHVQDSQRTVPVYIGDHVWISHGASILKGSIIPDGCIVGAKSLISKSFVDKNSLIAGVPAKVCKKNIQGSFSEA